MIVRNKKDRPGWLRLAGAGFELTAAVLGFAAVGLWLGRYFGNANLGLMIGAILGIVGGLYNLIRASLVVSRNNSRPQQSEQDKSGS